jgi:hypothetical protein
MKYALIIIEGPKGSTREDYADADNLARNIGTSLQGKAGVTKLNQFAYLCSLEHGLSGLTALVAAASARNSQSRTLFFDQEPSFVISK